MWFELYYEPRSVDECIDDLLRHAPDALPLAGGTDLIPRFKDRKRTSKALVNLISLDELKKKQQHPDGSVTVGALVTLRSLMGWDGIGGSRAAVNEGVGSVSSIQVRNVATLGGNSCNASPAADTVPGLIAADAEVGIAGPGGLRRLRLEDFFVGPGTTVLQSGELVVGFHLPLLPARTGSSYQKHAIRGNSDVALVGVGVRLSLDTDGRVSEARVALGAVAPTAIRAARAEEALVGRMPTAEVIDEAAALAGEESRPITDVRATDRYRREMVRVFSRRALTEAALRAAGSGDTPLEKGANR